MSALGARPLVGDDAILAEAEKALLEGDFTRARALLDGLLAREPYHSAALEMKRDLDELEPHLEAPALEETASPPETAPAPPSARAPEALRTPDLGDLRPDTRHLEAPSGSPPSSPPASSSRQLPLGVVILGFVNLALGGVTALLGLALLRTGRPGIALLLLGALIFASGIALWRMRAWGWGLAMVTSVGGFVVSSLAFVAGDRLAFGMALVHAAVGLYLWRVRGLFLKPLP